MPNALSSVTVDRISTTIAHLVLVISSCWTCKETQFELGFASVGIMLYVATGVFGTAIYGCGDSGRSSYKVYSFLWLCSLALGLPSISSQLYISNNFCTEITILHFLPPFLFIICSPFLKRTQYCVLETMQTVYLLAVCYISFLNGNYYGFALVVSYGIAFYLIGFTGMIQNTPAKDLLSFSLAFSNFFTVRTLKGNTYVV